LEIYTFGQAMVQHQKLLTDSGSKPLTSNTRPNDGSKKGQTMIQVTPVFQRYLPRLAVGEYMAKVIHSFLGKDKGRTTEWNTKGVDYQAALFESCD
jgi:hypothetical protein